MSSDKIHVCRICLDAKCRKRVSFHIDSEWSRLFEYCVGLPVSTGNAAPLEFCGACAEKLQEYSNFKKRCIKSDSLWKSKSCQLKCGTEQKYLSAKFTKEKTAVKEEDIYEEYLEIDISNDDHDYCSIKLHETIDYGTNGDPMIKEDNKRMSRRIRGIKIEKQEDIKIEPDETPAVPYYEEICIKEESSITSEQKSEIPNLLIEKPQRGRRYNKWECEECGKKYKTKVYLNAHIRNCYGGEMFLKKTVAKPKSITLNLASSMFYCGICKFTSADSESVRQHFIEHCNRNDLICTLCNYVGRDLADMVYHRYEHHPKNDAQKYICPLCSKVQMVRLKLQFHYRSVHLKKKGGLCSFCNKALSGYKHFRNHEKLHTTANYICDHCGRRFLFRNKIIRHMKDHGGPNFICDTCGRGFQRMTNLRAHVYNIHTEKPIETCPHCNRTFKGKTNLEYHIKITHREKPFICEICSKGYTNLSMLKSHVFWHTGDKPYSCDVCGLRYKAKAQLKLHMFKHTGFKPHKCAYCDKSFDTGVVLRRHESVHTGIRRVNCLYCERTFHAKALMYAHCKSKHNVDVTIRNSTSESAVKVVIEDLTK